MIEAKLTQQLAHIEQTPFYGVFIKLKKAFDAMDWERALMLLDMRRLIHHFSGTRLRTFAVPRGIMARLLRQAGE